MLPKVLKGNPAHLTICVSLWGFQLKVPEEQLARDVMEAASLADDAEGKLAAFEGLRHAATMKNRDEIRSLQKKKWGRSPSELRINRLGEGRPSYMTILLG